jgi:penicillin-binding protein 1C
MSESRQLPTANSQLPSAAAPQPPRSVLGWRPRIRAGMARVALLAVLACAVWLRCGPLPAGLLDAALLESTVVVDRHGVPLYEALSADGTRSARVTADAISPAVAAATVAAEDHRFWSHHGVDPVAMLRAARRNLLEGQVVEGGSTITQQAAKLMLLGAGADRRRGWTAKIREAVVALRLEHRLTKAEILAAYLNLASYGNQITGIERASRAYFGTGSEMLTIAQAAFLAGLPQRPSAFNPYRSENLAVSRQRVVLRRMIASGAITAAEAEEARGERLNLSRDGRPFLAPHFVEMVLAGTRPSGRSARLVTTLDASLQREVAGIVRSHRRTLERHGAANVAVVVLDNLHGEWLAWEGSGDYLDHERGGTINGPVSPRQPGSALKPFTYALAFEEGLTPATVLPDVPMTFPTAEPGVVYSPRNYDGKYRGPLLARAALAGSENVPAVSVAAEIGVPRILRFLHRAGFSSLQKTAAHYGLGITLGNAEVRLDELVAAYAAFARGGEWMAPAWLPSPPTPAERRRLVSERTAFWITDILSDADARAYIFGRGGSLDFPFPVAVKTGTSQAYHDNWTIGYTRRLTVGVWVGNFNRQPLRNSSGVTGAAPIFQAVMLAAHARVDDDGAPLAAHASLTSRRICALSGHVAGAWCPSTRREWLPHDDPGMPCSWHHESDGAVTTVWPAEYREWARQHGRAERAASTPGSSVAAAASHASSHTRRTPVLEIVSPPAGATYMIDPTLRREFQTLPLRVVSAVPTTVEWSVNGVKLGDVSSESSLDWPLRAGRHTISARDRRGQLVESAITVR